MTYIATLLPGAVFIVLLALHNVNHQDLSKTNRGPVGQTGLALWAAPKNPEDCQRETFNPSCKCTQMFCVGWQGPNPLNGMSWWKTPHAGIDRGLLRHAYNFFVHCEVRINQFFVDSCVLTAMMSMIDKLQHGRVKSFVLNMITMFIVYVIYMGGHFVGSYLDMFCKFFWIFNPIYYIINLVCSWCFTAWGSSFAMLWYMDKNEAAFKAYVVMLFWQFVQVVCARIIIMCKLSVDNDFERLQFLNYLCGFWILFVCVFQLDYFYEMANPFNTQRVRLMCIYVLFAIFCWCEGYDNYGKTLQQIREQTETWKLEYYACESNPVTTKSQAATGNLMNIPGVKNLCTGLFGFTILPFCTVPLGCDQTTSVIRGWYSPDQFWSSSVKNPMHDEMVKQMVVYAFGFFRMFANGEYEKKSRVDLFEIIVTCFGTILSWWGCDFNFKATGNKASPQKAAADEPLVKCKKCGEDITTNNTKHARGCVNANPKGVRKGKRNTD